MGNGLFLDLKSFQALPIKKKLDCLYENQLKSFELAKDQKKVYNQIQLNQKIQYIVLTFVVGSVIFLFKNAVGGV